MANKRSRVLVFGKSGLLGGEFLNFFQSKGITAFGCDSKSCDITDFKRVSGVIKKINPDIVINCAAKIGIDECEKDPLGAYMVNSIGPGNIARALKISNKNAVFLQISTSYVFDGKKIGGYKEDADPKLANVYGWSKFLGEKITEQELKGNGLIKYLIIRTGWLYGGFRRTFIEDIVDSLTSGSAIRLVSDNHNVPTWTRDLVRGTVLLLKRRTLKSGTYHLFNSYKKPVAKYDIGIYVADILGISHRGIKMCRYEDVFEFGRRANSILLNSKTPDLPDWKRALRGYLKFKYGNGLNLK